METAEVNEKTTAGPVDMPPLLDMTDEEEKEEGQHEDSGAPRKVKPRPTCRECGKTYANARMLGFHKAVHLKYDERSYGCETCGRRYAYPSHLARHRRQKHLGSRTQSQAHVDIHTQPEEDVDIHMQPEEENAENRTQAKDEEVQAPVE
jgi:hypothetical protein